MTGKTTQRSLTAWLGAGALAGLLAVAVPATAAEAQDTAATRQDTSAVQQDTSRQAAAGEARTDTTQWGRTAEQDPQVQNPPGYRGMERPVNVFPADSADTSSAGDATTRTSQLKRQDTISSENQNPAGYRGMERPAGTDTTAARQGDSERARWDALLKAARNQPNPSPELQDAINKLGKQPGDSKAKTGEKAGMKKKASTTKKQATTKEQGTTTERQTTERDSASTIRAGQDTTGDTTRYEVNAQEGRSATDAERDTTGN